MALKKSIAQLIKDEWNKAESDSKIAQTRSGVTATKFTPERNCAITAPHWIETYSPSNCDRYQYFRYVWMEGQKLRHRHLPGGNIKNTRAKDLKEKVDIAILGGFTPAQIEQLIRGR